MTEIIKARWYPSPAPGLDGESADAYTDRLTGALGAELRPYDHARNRQCSIGYHMECSRWRDEAPGCECPCHADGWISDGHAAVPLRDGAARLAGLYGLPRATALRVMVLASEAAAGSPDPSREDVAGKLAAAYCCEQDTHFITDVLSIYRAAMNGTLR